jgi:oligopeptide transport system substrate-binding protein
MLALLIGSALGLSLTGGCLRQPPPPDLVIINGKEPESLDPAVFTGQGDGRIGLALFEGLTRYDPATGQALPGLAESWQISPDGRHYQFHVRTNAAWSTGEPLTAHDLEYSWRRVIEPMTGCDYAGILFCVTNVEAYLTGRLRDFGQVGFRAVGERTFQVDLIDPTPFFLELCAYPTLAAVPRCSIEVHGDRWLNQRPVPCSGAYELLHWRVNDRVRVRKNRYYWDAANTASEVVDLLSVAHPTTALNLYETGMADVIWDKDAIPSELIDALRGRPDFHTFDYLATYFLRFNVTRAPFHDPRVRRAFALAVDKRSITTRVTRGGERPADHFVPYGLPGYLPGVGPGRDPELARALLQEAGYGGARRFPRVEYLFDQQRDHQKIAVELQQMWRDVLGVEVDLRAVEWKVFLPAQAALEYQICRSSWIGDYNDPNTFLDLFLSENPNNRTGWRSPVYDQLLRRANGEADPARRLAALREAELVLVGSEMPIVPLYFYRGFNLWDPARIDGIQNNLRDEHPLRVIRRKPPGAKRGHDQ